MKDKWTLRKNRSKRKYEGLRVTESLNGFSRNVISEWKPVVNYHFLRNRLPQKGDFSASR